MVNNESELSEQRVDLPKQKGSGTSWASSDEHLQEICLERTYS